MPFDFSGIQKGIQNQFNKINCNFKLFQYYLYGKDNASRKIFLFVIISTSDNMK